MASVSTRCPHCKSEYFGPEILHNCNPFRQLRAAPNITDRILGFIGHADQVSLARASKETSAILADGMQYGMLASNHYAEQSGKLRVNFFNEGVAAQKLFMIDPGLRIWERLSEAEKSGFRNRIKTRNGSAGPQATPDLIFKGEIADAVTISVSSGRPHVGLRTPEEERAHRNQQHQYSLSAIRDSLISNVQSKWNSYGDGSIAIANISAMAASVPTIFIVDTLRSTPAITDRLHNHGLYLIRNDDLIEVKLPPVPTPAEPAPPYP